MHHGRSNTAANGNATSDATWNSLANFASKSQRKAANYALRINSLVIANCFVNEMAKNLFSLRKLLANGRLR